jgi:hypothetical protein
MAKRIQGAKCGPIAESPIYPHVVSYGQMQLGDGDQKPFKPFERPLAHAKFFNRKHILLHTPDFLPWSDMPLTIIGSEGDEKTPD